MLMSWRISCRHQFSSGFHTHTRGSDVGGSFVHFKSIDESTSRKCLKLQCFSRSVPVMARNHIHEWDDEHNIMFVLAFDGLPSILHFGLKFNRIAGWECGLISMEMVVFFSCEGSWSIFQRKLFPTRSAASLAKDLISMDSYSSSHQLSIVTINTIPFIFPKGGS